MRTPLKSLYLSLISIALVIIIALLELFLVGSYYLPGLEYYNIISLLILIIGTIALMRGIKEKNIFSIILSSLSLLFFIGRFLLLIGYSFWWLSYFYF